MAIPPVSTIPVVCRSPPEDDYEEGSSCHSRTTAATPSFAIGSGLTVGRLSYGTMRLTGPGYFDPPSDPERAITILRRAVGLRERCR